MEADKEFWLWTFFLIIFMTGSHCVQKQSPTSIRRNEQDLLKTVLSLLQQHVKDQDIKMKNLEKELISIKKSLSQCYFSTDSSSSSGDDGDVTLASSSTTRKSSTATTKSTTEIAMNTAKMVSTTSMAATSLTIHLPTSMETFISSSSEKSEDTTTTKLATARATINSTTTAEKNTSITGTTTATTPPSLVTQLPTSMGSRGKEFLILFMRNYYEASGSVTVYITTDNNTSVDISTSPHLIATIKSATDILMNVSSYSNIALPYNLTCDYLTTEAKAVLLQTSKLSAVSIFDSFHEHSNDGTLIIPTSRLSTKYLVSSTNPYSVTYDHSQFAVAALYDRTSVKIRFKIKDNTSISLIGRTYRDKDVFTTSLNQYETLQIMHNADLSGTFITSTKPIAVFSGNQCQSLGNSACSHMVTQLPPTSELDNIYIVPPFYGNSGTLIQVISEGQSFINISVGSSVSKWNMNEKEFRNAEVTSDEVTIIESDNPVLVTTFAMGSSNNDPYMTVFPGVHQYIDYYKIVVPEGYTNNYVCVIIPLNFANYLQINGLSADHYNLVRRNSAVIGTTFSIYTFEVNNGPIVLSTTTNSTFGLIVYGHRNYDGYAFAGNYILP